MFYSPALSARKRALLSDTADAAQSAAPAVSHVHQMRNLQIEALAEFAPLLAAASTLSAFVITLVLSGRVAMPILASWTILVVAFNWLAMRRLQATAFEHIARPASAIVIVESSIGVAIAAAIWVSIPAAVFADQIPEIRVLLAGAISAMLCGALAIAVAPLAASAWALTLSVGLAAALWMSGASKFAIAEGTLLVFDAAFVLAVVRRFAGLADKQIRRASEELRQSQMLSSLMHEYEEHGTSWLWQTDEANRLHYVSPQIAMLLNKPTSNLIGQPLPALFGGSTALGEAMLAQAGFDSVDIELSSAGARRWLAIAGNAIHDRSGQFRGFRGTATDITETRSSERRLRNLARLDVLTGLPNRLHIRELLGQALEQAQANNVPCAILFLDLDGFKPVNDTFGHPQGDAVLQTVAQRLVETVGDQGIVGRLGGDEFAIVLGDAQSRKRVFELADRLIARVTEPYALDAVSVRIGLSIGCAFGPIDGNSVDDLLKKADLALYDAKAQGRGTCRTFDPRLAQEAEDRVRLETDLADALKGNQFRLLYQPLVDAQTQEVTGFEALLRWQHPERGFVSPTVFVPVAEEAGLIGDIGEWVVRTACRDAASWPEPITVAVNLSPLQLLAPGLPGMIGDALAKSRLAANRLELEVTESVFLNDSTATLDVLKRLRALGVRIALDDFGTGYSSLGYLNRTIFNKLKIDGSFVRGAATRPETVSIIQAIVTLANCFQMTITAEGVESHEDYRRMAELGCHQIQGYLFGRPLPFERATELVGTRWEQRAAG